MMVLIIILIILILVNTDAHKITNDYINVKKPSNQHVLKNHSWYCNNTDNNVFFHNMSMVWLEKTFPFCWSLLLQCKCSKKDNHQLYQTTCKRASDACQMLKEFWIPLNNVDLLECSNFTYSKHCGKNMTANTYSTCGYPLIETKNSYNWVLQWITIESNLVVRKSGCALNWSSEMKWSNSYEKHIKFVLTILSCFAFSANCFTMLSFVIDWKNQKRYPAFILFIMNACFAFCILGWLAFLKSDNVPYSANGERRIDEPKSYKSITCMLSFVLLYFSSISIACWFVLLSFSWKISFQSLRTTSKKLTEKNIKYFHVIVWSLSTFATLTIILMKKVDGHEFIHVCFVGYKEKYMRIVFAILPYTCALVIGEYFLITGILELIKLREECKMFQIPKATLNITHTICRLFIYCIVNMVFSLVSISCFIYDDWHEESWLKEYREYIRCRILNIDNISYYAICSHPPNYKLYLFYIQFTGLILCCLATSSWTWTRATGKTWLRAWKRYRKQENKKVKARISWYNRMMKKKIEPFLPPIDPDNPLATQIPGPLRHAPPLYGVYQEASDLKPYPYLSQKRKKRRQSEDIRTVLNLFSSRRGSKLSMTSIVSALSKRSIPLESFQSFGHLTRGYNVVNTPLRSSSNLSIRNNMGNQQSGRRNTNLSLEYFNHLRNNVCTPLAVVHKSNIVADCLPYNTKAPSLNKFEDRMFPSALDNVSIGPWSLKSEEMKY